MNLGIKIAAACFAVLVLSLVFLGYWSVHRAENNLNHSYSLYLDTVLDRYISETLARSQYFLESNDLEGPDGLLVQYQNQALKSASRMRLTEKSGLVIVDLEGRILYSSPGLDLSQGQTRLAELAAEVRNRTIPLTPEEHLHLQEGRGWLFRARLFKPWDWTILGFVDHSLIHRAQKEIRLATLGVVAASLVVAGVLIMLLLNRFLTRPILALQRAAERIAGGEDVAEIEIGASDELGALARSMEAMSGAIRDYRKGQRQWQSRLERQVRDRTSDLVKANRNLLDQVREKERTRKALERSESLFRELVEHLPLPVAVSTAEMKADYVNHRFVEVFGFGAGELPGRKDWKSYLAPAGEGTDPWDGRETGEDALTAKDGRKVEVRSWVFQAGPARYIVLEDVTERHRDERERDRKNRLEGAMEMAGAACHELNQPLQVITGHLDLLNMRQEKDPDLERRIGIIFKQLEAMLGLIAKIEGITRYEVKDYVGQTSILDLDRASRKTA